MEKSIQVKQSFSLLSIKILLILKMNKTFFVYIVASLSRRLYTGVTSDLQGRMWQHKNKTMNGFTKKYNINRLVWFVETDDWHAAFEEEKRIKGWRREKKIQLLEKTNLYWQDLSEQWFE